MKIRKKNGFTLIELLVVATIIVVLSAIGLVSFTNAGKS
nr:prepilin-type N-terminal cleavage/methylation domain-containing protein [Candidatus Woesebacteria bacterium]